ncbi:hypothetical protein [Litorimonas sp. WD9-15]|uniref:hypothetical protein n=1 Tax=Litorimonas sp. WD9-15 TaxID=3418716 RepID=UPI003D041AFB
MTDDAIKPVTPSESLPRVVGRPADLIATLLATLGTILSVIAAIWFFAGFAENDTRPEHLVSVFILTLGLFVLAIVPFAVVAEFARRAYRTGGRLAHYLWTLFLMLPWVVLGALSVTYTPLPVWVGFTAIGLATLLSVWALVSFGLDIRHHHTRSLSRGDVQSDGI